MDLIAQAVFTFTIFIIFATFHEYAHGWMAYRCGDRTAKNAGRLSLNPLVHIDPIMTVILPAMILISTEGRFAIGAAKPVPVTTYRLNNPKRDIIWVGLAGPLANVAWMIILIATMKIGLVRGVFTLEQGFPFPVAGSPFYYLLFTCMSINLVLLVFNMLPIPPLDGSRVVEGMLPDKHADQYSRLSRYGFIILILLMFSGILGRLFSIALRLVVTVSSIPYPLRFFQ